MRICLFGKYPPIQGGVSARTFHMAHGLARIGHHVHVVTNSFEVEQPWRLFMREEDWAFCEADYETGSVRVSWTDPMDRRQRYIPRNNPSVTKLTSLALAAHRETPFDIIHSYYLEPYGVAGHITANILDLPHVVKTAGSDAGKLWHHHQFEPFYDEIFRSADLIFAGGAVAKRAIEHGVEPLRVIANRGFQLSTNLFRPDGPALDLASLLEGASKDKAFETEIWGDFRGEKPYVGVYGKLGEKKGSFSLIEALAKARDRGAGIGLVAMAHGHPDIEARFRQRVEECDLKDRVLQIPFLPHWRVPSFIRSCIAVCCLEQDFPIKIHNPIVTDEVMSCGKCLIASTELLGKQLNGKYLVDGVNCLAVRDVFDTSALARILVDMAENPQKTGTIGVRGRDYIERFNGHTAFAARAAYLLEQVIEKKPSPALPNAVSEPEVDRVSLTSLALALLPADDRDTCLRSATSAVDTPEWVDGLAICVRDLRPTPTNKIETVRAAIHIDASIRAVRQTGKGENPPPQNLFRAGTRMLLQDATDLSDLQPHLHPEARLLAFDYDIGPYLRAQEPGDLPPTPPPGHSHLVVLPDREDSNSVTQIDEELAGFLRRCDGVQTCEQLVNFLQADLERLGEPLIALLIDGFITFAESEPADDHCMAATRF